MVAHRCPPENPRRPGWCWHECHARARRRIIRATMEPTVLIVDDHAAFRTATRALLEADGFVVAGEATDGAEGLALAAALRPAVVLLDIALPDADGFAVAADLARSAVPPQVILISSRERSAYGRRFTGAAIQGFIPKHALTGSAVRSLLR